VPPGLATAERDKPVRLRRTRSDSCASSARSCQKQLDHPVGANTVLAKELNKIGATENSQKYDLRAQGHAIAQIWNTQHCFS
jgi:hypothetical protein